MLPDPTRGEVLFAVTGLVITLVAAALAIYIYGVTFR